MFSLFNFSSICPRVMTPMATDPRDNDITLQNKIESFTSPGSGWNVRQIHDLSLCVSEHFASRPVYSFIYIRLLVQQLPKRNLAIELK